MTQKFLSLLLFAPAIVLGQDLVWKKGSNVPNQFGNYGTKGVSSPANNPGSRQMSTTWRDLQGNLWLFGGNGYSGSNTTGNLNDLWKYNIATNEWTWIRGSKGVDQLGVYGTQGVPSATNEPGARALAEGWVDKQGNLWLFGGSGFSTQQQNAWLNDLWRYNISTDEWTWMKGSTMAMPTGTYGTMGIGAPGNTPGARETSYSWSDTIGNLWMFGGFGYAGTILGTCNDLWKYNIAANDWTWVMGSNFPNQNGTYGTKKIPSSSNIPGARRYLRSCTDAAGNFWLFGGEGYDATGSVGHLNDLWKFNPYSGQWTWVSGTSMVGQAGNYGTKSVPASTNMPGGRMAAALWADNAGNIWLLGGYGWPANGPLGQLNDLWRYNVAADTWTWMKGTDTTSVNGIFGTQGLPSPSNESPSRTFCAEWTDLGGNPWFLGGNIWFNSNLNYGNDLWTLEICDAPGAPTVTVSPASPEFCGIGSATITAAGAGTLSWFNVPGGGSASVTGSMLIIPSLTITTTFYAQAFTCGPSLNRTPVTVTVHALPSVTAIAQRTIICMGEQVVLDGTGAASYVWEPGSLNATTLAVSPNSSTAYTVTGTDANGCVGTDVISILVSPCTHLEEDAHDLVQVFPNPSNDRFTISGPSVQSVSIYDCAGHKIAERKKAEAGELNVDGLPGGSYLIRITCLSGTVIKKLIVSRP